jgi:uroporphyrin-III C-methyltransferase
MKPAEFLTRARAWATTLRVSLIVVVALFFFQWWDTRAQVAKLREEVALKLKEDQELSRQSQVLAREAQARLREALGRMSALEAKLGESQSQQAALENLYQELSRNRDEWALTEIDQILTLASQQLQLAGNVRGALIALQTADARLGRADRTQFIGIRRVLQKDIERLKSLPVIDTAGLALKLDTLIAQADTLPLMFDERLQAPMRGATNQKPPAPNGTAKADNKADNKAEIKSDNKADNKTDGKTDSKTEGRADKAEKPAEPSALTRLRDEAWTQFRQLVRIRELDGSDPILLNPNQSFFLRENLKLRLLNARIALLQRNDAVFRQDIAAAAQWTNKFFDVRSRSGAQALATLTTMSANVGAIELPTLSESLNAVRNYKAANERVPKKAP